MQKMPAFLRGEALSFGSHHARFYKIHSFGLASLPGVLSVGIGILGVNVLESACESVVLTDFIDKENGALIDRGILDEIPSPFLDLYISGAWSGSVARKGNIESITWHSLFKMYEICK